MMIDALLLSQILLWILVLVLTGLVVVLARQVGLLHERVAPAGALALSKGPAVGEAAPRIETIALNGETQTVGEADSAGRSTLLFFLSPTCPVCKTLLPTVQRIARENNTRLLLASDGDELDHAALVRDHNLDSADYFVSREVGLQFQIAKLPYGVLIDGEGVVRSQGIVNTREHLESLFEAEALGVASIQDYLQRERPTLVEQGAKP
ncbi:MAG: methylamine dehydrogenase accessory protein MauD [Myxococcota bacterium]